MQVAPQETEISSYVIGGTKQDVSEDTFKGMIMSSLKFGASPFALIVLEQKLLCENLQLNYEYKELGIDFDRELTMETFGARTSHTN